jgi:deoxyribodipyrimidine photo-lyase
MNIKKTKDLIKQAIENLPLDFRFEDIKIDLNKSLNKINELEQKDSNKFNMSKKWKQNSEMVFDNYKKFKTKYAIKNIDTFYEYNDNIHVNGGRKEALKILKNIREFKNYENTRNTLSLETTNLSAYLKFGCLSIREVYYKLLKTFNKNHPLIRQLIWRDFYYHLGYGFIDRFGDSLKPQYDKIKWENNRTQFNSWKEGRTGYPVIDACMTQLNETGYMHNRGRLLTSSFLIKNLGIDWRWGEKYFAQSLVDYDVLVNNGNWQWGSGSGADSQPYFRTFNPWLQSERYDKDCEYIKYWLPNLESVDNKHLHNWEKFHNNYNLKDIEYVKPMIDYKKNKDNVMNIYRKALN